MMSSIFRFRRLLPSAIAATCALAGLADAAIADGPRDRLDVVDRAIQVHGGDLFSASETELDICSKSGCFRVRAKVDGDAFEYEVSGKTRDGNLRVLSTNASVSAWLDGEALGLTAEREQTYRDWAMARVYFCFLPYRLNDPGVLKEDLGVETWDGAELRRVRVTFPPGSSTDADDVYTYWFDEATGRLSRFAYSYSGNPGGIRFRNLKHFRRVGGLLFFDQENHGTEGPNLHPDGLNPKSVGDLRSISEIELRNVKVRPLAPEAISDSNE